MKTAVVLSVVLGVIAGSCNNGSGKADQDSTKTTVLEVDSTAGRLKDSTNRRREEIREAVEDRMENTDTTKK